MASDEWATLQALVEMRPETEEEVKRGYTEGGDMMKMAAFKWRPAICLIFNLYDSSKVNPRL